MSNYNTDVTEFCLEGRFLDFVIKDGHKLKGLRLATASGECYVKLAKHLRAKFDWRLAPGTWLEIVGEKKYDFQTGEVKLKALQVMANNTTSKAKPQAAKATILICQKSDCAKRGSKAVCQALESALSDRGLEQVSIISTGCMKNCKAGPNLVMPDKSRHTHVKIAEVPTLIDKHLKTHCDIPHLT